MLQEKDLKNLGWKLKHQGKDSTEETTYMRGHYELSFWMGNAIIWDTILETKLFMGIIKTKKDLQDITRLVGAYDEG